MFLWRQRRLDLSAALWLCFLSESLASLWYMRVVHPPSQLLTIDAQNGHRILTRFDANGGTQLNTHSLAASDNSTAHPSGPTTADASNDSASDASSSVGPRIGDLFACTVPTSI